MNLNKYLADPAEKPLERIVDDGGFTSIFRTIGCIGDSLSSGEFESTNPEGTEKGYHDYFEYSWGQYIARAAGCKVINFSRGGMTAIEYMQSFADANDFWNPDKLCQAYIIALGVNDLYGRKMPVGSIEDINAEDPEKNADTFCGWYAKIIQRLKTMQPKAKFFLMTMPRGRKEGDEQILAHRNLLHDLREVLRLHLCTRLHGIRAGLRRRIQEEILPRRAHEPRWIHPHREDDHELHRLHHPPQHGGFRAGRLHRQGCSQLHRQVVNKPIY